MFLRGTNTISEYPFLLINIGNKDGSIAFTRDLDYGFSISAHKSQGSTYDTVMVDVNDIVYDKAFSSLYCKIEVFS